MKRRGWDTEKARALYDEKLSDAEIAGRIGTTASAVAYWHPPPQEGPEPKAVPPPSLSRPLALPVMKGPVELSIEMDGHAFALRAPDLEGAARIYEYAGRLLKDMEQAAARLKEGMDHD